MATGDLSQALPVRSNDEVGRLTRAFNGMLEGLRQRDFIRDTFGRYVSPEVAKTLLESPEGLKFGGEKRVVTILMSDLRGYTRFAEQGDPAWVMEVLNGYLARMTEIIIGYGGTINEFIGDAVFAIFGAPIAHGDHAERAAAAALAMQERWPRSTRPVRRGLPRSRWGSRQHGEAVVGTSARRSGQVPVVGNAVTSRRGWKARRSAANLLSAARGSGFKSWLRLCRLPRRSQRPTEPCCSTRCGGCGAASLLGWRGEHGERPQMDVTLPGVLGDRGQGREPEHLHGIVVRWACADRRPLRPSPRLPHQRPPPVTTRARHDSGDLYGKVVAGDDPTRTRIRFTSVEASDRRSSRRSGRLVLTLATSAAYVRERKGG